MLSAYNAPIFRSFEKRGYSFNNEEIRAVYKLVQRFYEAGGDRKDLETIIKNAPDHLVMLTKKVVAFTTDFDITEIQSRIKKFIANLEEGRRLDRSEESKKSFKSLSKEEKESMLLDKLRFMKKFKK